MESMEILRSIMHKNAVVTRWVTADSGEMTTELFARHRIGYRNSTLGMATDGVYTLVYADLTGKIDEVSADYSIGVIPNSRGDVPAESIEKLRRILHPHCDAMLDSQESWQSAHLAMRVREVLSMMAIKVSEIAIPVETSSMIFPELDITDRMRGFLYDGGITTPEIARGVGIDGMASLSGIGKKTARVVYAYAVDKLVENDPLH